MTRRVMVCRGRIQTAVDGKRLTRCGFPPHRAPRNCPAKWRQPSDVWNEIHLYEPRALTAGSIMPSYRYLFAEKERAAPGDVIVAVPPAWAPPGKVVVATQDVKDLTAYIESLKQPSLGVKPATWLFQLICQRYEHRSTIITSNKPFADWGQIFSDTTLAGALLDRLLHHSHILSLKGDSYRMRSKTQGTSVAKRKSAPHVGPP